MRISKDGPERRREILDTALAVFSEKGYDDTTLDDILKRIGITKGAFYYYFNTKEGILETLINEQVDMKLSIVSKAVGDTTLKAIEKINFLIAESQKQNFSQLARRMALFRPAGGKGDGRLVQAVHRRMLAEGTPLIESIINQGVSEGALRTEYPSEAARLYLELLAIMKTRLGELINGVDDPSRVKTAILQVVAFYQQILETILGLAHNTLVLVETTTDALSHLGE